MKVAARTMLLLILVAIAINFLQGGPSRVTRWIVRTLTGKDLLGPTTPTKTATTTPTKPTTQAA